MISKLFLAFILLITLIQGCEAKSAHPHKIATIPEASGACYNPHTHSLYIVGDEGRLYRLNPQGKILSKKYLGHHNFEGVACDNAHHRLYLAVEGKDNVLQVSQAQMNIQQKIKIKRTYKDKIILKKDWKKHGLEGITLINGTLYLTNQSHKFLPKKDPSVIFSTQFKNPHKLHINGLIDLHQKDLSGLDYHNGFLYVISDKNDKIWRYDLQKEQITQTIKLPKGAWEGIAFGENADLFLADDNGYVWKMQLPK